MRALILFSTILFSKKSLSVQSQTIIEDSLKALIVGGGDTTKGRYPYQVVWYDNFGFMCGGTLITSSHVLTAAHCYDEEATERFVEIGRYDRSDSSEDIETIPVESVYIHPNFPTEKPTSDIMILKLQSESSFPTVTIDDGSHNLDSGKEVKAIGYGFTVPWSPNVILGIPFPEFSDIISRLFPRLYVWINGGGDEEDFSDILQETYTDIVTRETCKKAYPNRCITSEMICVAREGSGSCKGDSGSPLLISTDDETNYEFDVQIGITSFGIGCGDERFPGIYTKVSSFKSWIDEVVEGTASPWDPNDSLTMTAVESIMHILSSSNECKE